MIKLHPFEVKRINAAPLWSLDEDFPFENYSFHTKGEGEATTVYADQYLGISKLYGAGRAALVEGHYVKGIGRTPLTTSPDYYYATGELCLTDGIKEVIYLSLIKQIFPDAIKPLGLIVLPHNAEKNLSGAAKLGLDLNSFSQDKIYDIGCLLIREFPIRYSHVFIADDPMAFLLMLRPILADLSPYEMFKTLLTELVRKQVILNIHRISTGYAVYDNFDIWGNIVDTTIFTVKPDFRNTFTESKHVLFLSQTIMYAANFKGLFESNLFFQTFDFDTDKLANDLWIEEIHRLLGITAQENRDLIAKIPYEYREFCKAVVSLIKQQAYLNGLDTWDCADDTLFTPVIGVNPRTFFPAILNNVCPDPHIAQLWKPVVQALPTSDKRLEHCILVNCDLSSELRNEPELDIQIKKLLSGSRSEIPTFINEKIALIKASYPRGIYD